MPCTGISLNILVIPCDFSQFLPFAKFKIHLLVCRVHSNLFYEITFTSVTRSSNFGWCYSPISRASACSGQIECQHHFLAEISELNRGHKNRKLCAAVLSSISSKAMIHWAMSGEQLSIMGIMKTT